MPYQTALLGLAASLIFVVSWFWRAGMACSLVFAMLVVDIIWFSGEGHSIHGY